MPIKHYGRATVIVGQLCMDRADDREAVTRALSSLDHTAAHIAETHAVPVLQTRFLLGGWQMFLPIQVDGLRESVMLFAGAISAAGSDLGLRLCVGNGDAAIPDSGNINHASGTAFTTSGRLLDAKKHRRIDHADPVLSRSAFRTVNRVCSSWSITQARAVGAVLDSEVADMDRAAQGLGWDRKALLAELDLAKFNQIKDMIGLSHIGSHTTLELVT